MEYSVLMSVYAREKAEYFKQAVDSMLSQTVPPDEIVLVCDGALTPELDQVIEGYESRNPDLFHVIRLEKNHGLGIALGIGLQACKNELVARMDTDDIALPDRLEKELAALEANPDVCAVGGRISEFYDDPEDVIGYRVVPLTHEEIRKRASFANPMNHVTVLYRKSSVLAAGNYPNHPGFEDYHLWVQMLSDGHKFMNIADVCCNVRADDGMHERRRGMEYFRYTWEMEKFLREKRVVTFFQFWKNVAVRFSGTVLLPPRLTNTLFQKIMRRPENPAC